MKRVLGPLLAVLFCSFIFLSCSQTGEEKSPMSANVPIAIQIDNNKIDSSALERYLETRPLQVQTGNADDLIKKKVDELVVEELLYHEALRLKLDQTPETQQRIKEILISKLMTDQHKIVMQRKVEPTELQAYYAAHSGEFNRPEEVRIADIFISVPKNATADQQSELKQKAEMALAEALASTNRHVDFSRLVQKYSDTPEKYAKGDTGFFSAEGKPIGIDDKIVTATFQLEKIGDVSKAVIETDDGLHVIMKNGQRPAVNRPLEQVRRDLERRIKTEELKKKRDELVDGLKSKAKITINEKVLAQIQENMKSAQKTMQNSPVKQTSPHNSQTDNP